LVSSFARADRATEAKSLFEKANTHFAVGEFADAGETYLKAYKVKPDPAFLYNAAQSFRLAGNNERALILYKNYIQFYPDVANSDEVRTQIMKLKEALSASEKARSSPPTGTTQPLPITPEPGPRPAESPAVAPPPPSEHPILISKDSPTSKSERSKPIYTKWWLWTIVGVVVAGGVVAAAVVTTQPSGSWTNAPDVGPGSKMGLVFP
jgi:tetratricopeptide (TPR) repeat protein